VTQDLSGECVRVDVAVPLRPQAIGDPDDARGDGGSTLGHG
jgi:hypothetical protein